MHVLDSITWPGLNGLLEMFILAVGCYYILLFIQGTRGAQVLSGMAVLFFFLIVITYVFNLDTLNWLLSRITVYLVVALLVIFQPEIRRALAELGRQHVFATPRVDREVIECIARAAGSLAEKKVGALIAMERETSTKPIQETGTAMDSLVSEELLTSIFFPYSPLHDGGVIIRKDRILAAGCLFPLSQRVELSRTLGTRHRAAVGLTEEADAIAVIVSEETGAISVAYKGRLRRGLDGEHLKRMLTAVLLRERRPSRETPLIRKLGGAATLWKGRSRPETEESAENRAT
jgi:diadenylate cyclase